MTRIAVDVSDQPYVVTVGEGVRHEVPGVVSDRFPAARTVAIVTSPGLRVQPWFDVDFGPSSVLFEVPDGEAAKRLGVVERLCGEWARAGLSRRDVVVAIGGGAITDLVGFAAAVYLRGLPVVHLSTSVAGQVDAAIGGKTAVDIVEGKNLVGAFHQPAGVWCDTETLATLSERERRAGMGEVAKCWLLEGRDPSGLPTATLTDLIELSVALKARVVAADEFETTGQRALLNYGHTLGHALELLALARDPDELRHGEAVSLGLAFAARLARRLGRVGLDAVERTDAVLEHFGLPRRLQGPLDVEGLMGAMSRDKKAHHDLTFVLDGAHGVELVPGVDPAIVREELERFGEER